MRVEIRDIENDEDHLAGVLRLRGGRITAEPDSRTLRNILAQPVLDWEAGKNYWAQEQPEEYLRALHLQYRSPYLRASKAMEDDGGERVEKDHDASALAQHYADHWNLLREHGEDVPEDELHAASEELSDTDWRVTRRPDGEWRAHHYADKKALRLWRRRVKSWNKDKHPRGQPENKGEFAPSAQGEQQQVRQNSFQDFMAEAIRKAEYGDGDYDSLVDAVSDQADKEKERLKEKIDGLISHVRSSHGQGHDTDMAKRTAPYFEEYEKSIRGLQKELGDKIDAVRDAYDDFLYALTHVQNEENLSEDEVEDIGDKQTALESAQEEHEEERARCTEDGKEALNDLFGSIAHESRERNAAWEKEADDYTDSLNDDYEGDPEGAADDAKIVNEELKGAGNPYRVLLGEEGMWYAGFPEEEAPPEPEDKQKKWSQGELFKSVARRYVRKAFGPVVVKKAEHAPKGGIFLVNMQGEAKMYAGGQWIPAKDIANLPPAEKAKLESAKTQARQGRINRGDINPADLAGQLKPHARKLNAEENKRAVGELRALHQYHGDLTLHRIEQLANQQQQFLKRKNLTDKQKQQIEGNLARLHAMAVTAHRLGVTGKVSKEDKQDALVKTAKEENHPANPNASGTLNVQKFAEQPQFRDKQGKVDTAKALEAVQEIVSRHQEGGGAVQHDENGNLQFRPPARTESPMSPEDAAKALAKQAGHVAQPKEGNDAAGALNRQLIEEGKPKPNGELQNQIRAVEEATERWRKQEKPAEPAPKEEPKPAAPKMTLEQEERLQRNKENAAKAVEEWKNRSIPKSTETELEAAAARLATETPEERAAREASHHQDETPEERAAREEKEQKLREHYVLNYGPGSEHSKTRAEAHEREVWAGKARKEGIDPEHLHAAADEIRKADAEQVERRRQLLARAREIFASAGKGKGAYNAQALIANLHTGRIEDNVPYLDLVGHEVALEYPEEFAELPHLRNHNTKAAEEGGRLLELFSEGAPRPISQDKAYEQALDFLREHKEREAKRQEREPGVDEDDDDRSWYDEEEEEDVPFAWKSLRRWIQKARRAKPHGPVLPGMSNEAFNQLHPHQPAGSPKGGQFAPKHIEDALGRYANRAATAQGGGLFGGEDLQSRHGFSKLPHGTEIVFTHGELEGMTGKVVRDVDELTGAPRIVAEVDGRPGLVAISPDAIEPLDVRHSWRTEGGGTGHEEKQGALYTAEHYLPGRTRELSDQEKAILEQARIFDEVMQQPFQQSSKRDLEIARGHIEDEKWRAKKRFERGQITREQMDSLVDSCDRDAQNIDRIIKDRVAGRSAGAEDQNRAEKIAERAVQENRSALTVAREMGLSIGEYRDIKGDVERNVEEMRKLAKEPPSPARQRAMERAKQVQGEEDAYSRYEAITRDLRNISVEEMRARFAELASLPKAVLAGVLAKLGYPAESSKKAIETALLDNLTSLKISLDQTSRI